MKLVARCLSLRFARLQAARRCAHTRRASPPDLDQAVLGIPRRCPNIKELHHFLCISISTRLLSASSGSGHSGHPRWLSKPFNLESGAHVAHRHARNSSHNQTCFSTAACRFKMLLWLEPGAHLQKSIWYYFCFSREL